MKLSELKTTLFSLGLQPRKSMGQNFLVQEKIADRIVKEACITKKISVLEVGPGLGVLTERLLREARVVVAVELDDRLVSYLQQKFSRAKNFILIHDDILKYIQKKIPLSSPFCVIANLPYQITSHFFRLLFSAPKKPEKVIVMIQKEVAERIIAKNKKMSLLSFFTKWNAQPKILFHVARGNFWPVPRVESSVIQLTPYDNPQKQWNVTLLEEQKIFTLVHLGFSGKRKQLATLLRKDYGRERVENTLEKLGIVKTIRAEDLSIEEWVSFAKSL